MTRRQNPLGLLDDSADGASPSAPVFIIDMAAAAIVAANGAGWEAWGLAADAGANAFAIDRAMPVLRRLAAAARSATSETLTFWTARGLLRLPCRVEPVAAEGDAFLVRAMPANAGSAAQHANDRDGDLRMSALARLAHEVRTPLSAAIAYAEVLREEHFGPLGSARYRDYARTIHDSARHALSVVDGMLTGNAGGRGLPELAFRDLDPAGVIDNCVAVVRPLAERAGLELVTNLEPGTPRVIADEVSLKQMLLNLMTNAIKFARPGDRITLGLAHGVDGCLRIEVADTGPGMEAAAAWPGEDAVAPESHASGAGLGIGLPLTRALAEANGATLLLDSAPGRGTRVTIAFGKDRVVPV